VAAFRDGFRDLINEAPTVGDAVIDSLREAADRAKGLWAEMRADFAPTVAFMAKLGEGLWRGLQTAGHGFIGLITGGTKGAEDLVKELNEKFAEQDKALEAREAARHKPLPVGGLDETQSKTAAREEAHLAEEKLRLEERLFEIRQKSALEALPKEEQITELHRRRAQLALFVAQTWAGMSEKGRLQAQIDLETMAAQEAATERGLKTPKEKKEAVPARDVNQLQRIGAFAGATDPALQLHQKNERHLFEIRNSLKTIEQKGGGVNYG
jgi:hypothetical protein